MINDAKTPSMLERLRKMEKLLEELILDQEKLTREGEFPEYPKVQYDAGTDVFVIVRDENATHTLVVPMADIKNVGELPVALADWAHRHPQEWVTLADVERNRP